jgi:hypothetical protein
MASDLELVHHAFNRVKELTLIYGDSIPHLISIFQRTCPRRFTKYSVLTPIVVKYSVLTPIVVVF